MTRIKNKNLEEFTNKTLHNGSFDTRETMRRIK